MVLLLAWIFLGLTMTHPPVTLMMILPFGTSRPTSKCRSLPLTWQGTGDAHSSSITELQTRSMWSDKQESIACVSLLCSLTRWPHVLLRWLFSLKKIESNYLFCDFIWSFTDIFHWFHNKILISNHFIVPTFRNEVCLELDNIGLPQKNISGQIPFFLKLCAPQKCK